MRIILNKKDQELYEKIMVEKNYMKKNKLYIQLIMYKKNYIKRKLYENKILQRGNN